MSEGSFTFRFELSASWRTGRTVKKCRVRALQISDIEGDINAVEDAIAIDVTGSIKWLRLRTYIAPIGWRCSALEITNSIDNVNAVGYMIAVDIANHIRTAGWGQPHGHIESENR